MRRDETAPVVRAVPPPARDGRMPCRRQQEDWRHAPLERDLPRRRRAPLRFDLRRDIQFETRITRAAYDEETGEWTLESERGERFTATYCIMATGCLSVPRRPPFEGLERYEGKWCHTGQWPHEEVDFRGKRVGVVGTGSTAIQVIPIVAQQAAQLTIFQRTPSFSMPAWNGPLDSEEDRAMKAGYAEYRERARWSEVGVLYDSIEKPAAEVEPEQQQRELERQWRAGGFAMDVTGPRHPPGRRTGVPG